MEEETSFVLYEGVVVPESALRRAERRNPYGSVPGLDDEELADSDELERQVMRDEWGPVLALPVRGKRNQLRPAVDESGDLDWGAFATVDFERVEPEFDKMRYKADRLREKLRDVLIMFDTVCRRLPKAKSMVLKYLKMGVIELEHIASEDMRALARLYLRVRRLQKEIRELEEVSWRRQKKQAAEMLARWD